MGMERAMQVLGQVDAIVLGQADDLVRPVGFYHLYGVSVFCALLAAKRGLDGEICAIAGLLHDLATYESGDAADHAARSASRAEQLLAASGLFSPDEVMSLSQAISVHSAKGQTDEPLAELLKDADVLMHYLFNPDPKEFLATSTRLQSLLYELGETADTRC
jgi:uncharacterized protein